MIHSNAERDDVIHLPEAAMGQTKEDEHGILEDEEVFQAFIDNCDRKSFGLPLAKGNDFSTFFDNDGWGNG